MPSWRHFGSNLGGPATIWVAFWPQLGSPDAQIGAKMAPRAFKLQPPTPPTTTTTTTTHHQQPNNTGPAACAKRLNKMLTILNQKSEHVFGPEVFHIFCKNRTRPSFWVLLSQLEKASLTSRNPALQKKEKCQNDENLR